MSPATVKIDDAIITPDGSNSERLGAALVQVYSTIPVVPDGVSDYAAVIQSYLDQAGVSATNRTVALPSGTWVIGASLRVPSNVSLIGAGTSATIIKVKDHANVHAIINSDQVGGNVAISVRDLCIDGNKANQIADLAKYGIYFVAVDERSYLHNIEVKNVSGTGIFLDGAGLKVGPVQISDIYVHDNTHYGFQLSHAQRRTTIVGVLAELNGGWGVYFDASQASASNIYSRRNGGGGDPGGGIYLRNITGGNYVGLTAEQNQQDGILAQGWTYASGASWRSEQNSLASHDTYDEIHFGLNPFTTYGETSFISCAGILAGSNPFLDSGLSPTARYAIFIEDGVANKQVTLLGVQYGLTLTGSIRKPADVGTLVVVDNPTSLSTIYKSGKWYTGTTAPTTTAAASVQNTVRLYPFIPVDTTTITALAVRQGLTGAVGNIQAAIYASDPTTNLPTGNPLSSTASMDTSGSSVNLTKALNSDVQMQQSIIYWLATNIDNNTATFVPLQAASGVNSSLIGDTNAANNLGGGTVTWLGYSVSQTFGTWPDLTAASFSIINSATIPVVQFKVG